MEKRTSSAKKALIGFSGGVDSSVAALLMQRQGYDCIAAMMQMLPCAPAQDAKDAAAVAARLGLPFYLWDVSDCFCENVIRPFVSEYEAGRTPNPCILCNEKLKFGRFWEEAQKLDCDVMVTGHYAQVKQYGSRYVIRRAEDHSKDQSYVLFGLTQAQLSHTVLPLGTYTKAEIRAIAEAEGLLNAKKKDSQDICFVPDGDYAKVLRAYSEKDHPCGSFVDRTGKVLGTHKGIIHYTVGQRRGLGLALPAPMYVVEKRTAENSVVLDFADGLYSEALYADGLHWQMFDTPPKEFRCLAKIRYNSEPTPATVYTEDARVRVVFDAPQRAVTSGQAVVLYDGEDVLGGGWIL